MEDLPLNLDLLVIDEAAQIPLSLLKPAIKKIRCPVFISSTVHGYEGTGRSLSLKLIKELKTANQQNFREIKMSQPIRYQLGDEIENWLTKFLCLDATDTPPIKYNFPPIDKCKMYFVSKPTLFSFNRSSELFLKKVWSLFVSSHYKNSPNDLQMLADAPSHFLVVLIGPIGHQAKQKVPDVLVAA